MTASAGHGLIMLARSITAVDSSRGDIDQILAALKESLIESGYTPKGN